MSLTLIDNLMVAVAPWPGAQENTPAAMDTAMYRKPENEKSLPFNRTAVIIKFI